MSGLLLAFVLVSGGEPKCSVELCEDAHPATVTAAAELTNWVAKITGAELPVVTHTEGPAIVFALRNDTAFKDSDGYRVEERDGRFTIVAKYPKGHLNGVFRLLYKNSDIIFPRPGTEEAPVAIYSARASLEFNSPSPDGFDLPAFRFRHDGHSKTWEGRLWDMRNCLVTLGNWRWFMDKSEKADRARRLGIWDSYRNSWGAAHNMVTWWFPYKEHTDHPEFYMLTPVGRDTKNVGLCVSNPDLPAAYGTAVLKKLEDKELFPESVREIAILLEDTEQTCCCEACNAPFTCADGTVLTPNDPAYRSTLFFDFFVRAMEKVWAVYPDLVIRQYAYVYLSVPPRLKIPKNLQVEFCPYPKDMKESVFDGPANVKWRDRALGWLDLTDNVYWREYYFCGCIYYPRPISETAAVDFRVLAKRGIPTVYADGCTDRDSRVFRKTSYTSVKQPTAEFWDTTGIEKWIVGQLMWDPSQDPDALREEFLRRVFREAAPAMSRFYAILNDSWHKTCKYSGWQDAAFPSAAKFIVQAGRTQDIRQALDDAAKAAVHPVSREWVENVRRVVETWIKESPNYLTGPVRVPCTGAPADFPHFKLLQVPGSRGNANEPYGVRASVISTGEALTFAFFIPKAEGAKGPPRVEVQFFIEKDKSVRRFETGVRAEGDGWAARLEVPFAAVNFNPIQVNTIKCAPIVTFDFGGLGKDLPVSWEGALPFNSAGWGELVVDIE